MKTNDFFQLIKNSSESHLEVDGAGFGVHIDQLEESSAILNACLSDFPSRVHFFRVSEVSLDWGHDIETIWISNDHQPKIQIYTRPKLDKWKNVYSFEEYFDQLGTLANENYEGVIEIVENDWSEGLLQGIEISISDISADISLIDEVKRALSVVRDLHFEATKRLSGINQRYVTNIFDFPKELKTSCEQYLLYFAQFLQDLGINATSNLKEEAGKVLFSVAPTDDVEALDKIREALAVYLSLPSSLVLYNESFESLQLKQQVENLQHSQRMKEMQIRSAEYALRLAQQNIENQDQLISQQKSFIKNQNEIIEKITSKSIIVDSLENKEELEKFCEGFEVGKSEFLIKHFGLHLNPATVLKSVGKKILGKEDKTSILEADEEK